MAKQTETEGQRHRDLQTEIERHTERKGEKGRERECMLRPFITVSPKRHSTLLNAFVRSTHVNLR